MPVYKNEAKQTNEQLTGAGLRVAGSSLLHYTLTQVGLLWRWSARPRPGLNPASTLAAALRPLSPHTPATYRHMQAFITASNSIVHAASISQEICNYTVVQNVYITDNSNQSNKWKPLYEYIRNTFNWGYNPFIKYCSSKVKALVSVH